MNDQKHPTTAQADRIARWMRERVTRAGARGLVVGLSGGVDSALVARLCQLALSEAVVGVIMPCHSDPTDEEHASMVADHFGISVIRVPLNQAYEALFDSASRPVEELARSIHATPSRDDIKARVPLANMKPRLRMATLYFVANSLNYLVAGTGNRSELSIGYFTKYGDGGVDLLPIAHLVKSQVRALARELGVPDSVVDKPPSAGLWLGQTDEAEMGFSYAELEGYLNDSPDSVAPATALRIERLQRASEHKREGPAQFEE